MKVGSGTLMLAGANTFSGTTYVQQGTLQLANALALQNSIFCTDGSCQLSFGSLTSATLGGLSGSGNFPLNAGNDSSLAVSIGHNNASTTFSGQMIGGTNTSLVKVGSGSLTLTNTNNNFYGDIVVGEGVLAVDASGAVCSSRRIDIRHGAVLAVSTQVDTLGLTNNQTITGGGTIQGNIYATSGSHIAPGDGIGTLTLLGNMTLTEGALLDYELGTVANSDLICMSSSTLYINNLKFSDFAFTSPDEFGVGSYTLIDAGLISGNLGTDTLGNINGLSAYLSLSGNDLVLTVVPEPRAFILLMVAGISGLLYRLAAYHAQRHTT
jgi:autotransporter-associated beta strand protein